MEQAYKYLNMCLFSSLYIFFQVQKLLACNFLKKLLSEKLTQL